MSKMDFLETKNAESEILKDMGSDMLTDTEPSAQEGVEVNVGSSGSVSVSSDHVLRESAELDPRNLEDEYKGLSNERVVAELEKRRSALEVAIENVEHDFNVGTIVRSANNFNVSRVHIIGRRKYNRRGAMCTDKYLQVEYWAKMEDFLNDQRRRRRQVVAIENHTERALPLARKVFIPETTLVFGSEGNGLTPEILAEVDDVREIESFGSTRSVNVGVAAGIAMYEWARQCLLNGGENVEK